MGLKKFEHSSYKEVVEKWLSGKELNNDEIAVLVGTAESFKSRLLAMRDLVVDIAEGE
jgi:hypothetical protein